MNSKRHWTKEQEHFLNWINLVLSKKNEAIKNLTELQDGVYLCLTLEILSGKFVGRYNKKPTKLAQKIDNVSLAFTFIYNSFKTARFDVSSFANGNIHEIMVVIYSLIKNYGENPFPQIENRFSSSKLINNSHSLISPFNSLNDLPIKKKSIQTFPMLEPIAVPKHLKPPDPHEETKEVTTVVTKLNNLASQKKSNDLFQIEESSMDEDLIICNTCQQIIEGKFIEFSGFYFHSECFVCYQCKAELLGEFFSREGKYVCKNCMIRCEVCNFPISGDYFSGMEDKVFHPGCIPKNKCDRCDTYILPTTKKISILGKHWHEGCFLCHGCLRKLPMKFLLKGTSLYCSFECRNKI